MPMCLLTSSRVVHVCWQPETKQRYRPSDVGSGLKLVEASGGPAAPWVTWFGAARDWRSSSGSSVSNVVLVGCWTRAGVQPTCDVAEQSSACEGPDFLLLTLCFSSSSSAGARLFRDLVGCIRRGAGGVGSDEGGAVGDGACAWMRGGSDEGHIGFGGVGRDQTELAGGGGMPPGIDRMSSKCCLRRRDGPGSIALTF